MPVRWRLALALLLLGACQILVANQPVAQAVSREGEIMKSADAAPGATTMSLEEKKNLARRANDMWASDNTERPEDIFAETYVNHQEPDAKGSAQELSLKDWIELVARNHKAFSDMTNNVLMQIAEGDMVATSWQFTATQTGTYLGVAPTGKTLTWGGVQIDRIENGKIVESWVDWDKFRLFQELGLAKQPEQ